MIALSGELGKDLCDRHLPMSRRDVLKVGGSSMLGLSLGAMLQMKANASPAKSGGPGWGQAKSIIMIYLQGGQVTWICGTPNLIPLRMYVASLNPFPQNSRCQLH